MLALALIFWGTLSMAWADMSMETCGDLLRENPHFLHQDAEINARCSNDGLKFLCACQVLEQRKDPAYLDLARRKNAEKQKKACSDTTFGTLPDYISDVPLMINNKLVCKNGFCSDLEATKDCQKEILLGHNSDLEKNVLRNYCQENIPQKPAQAFDSNHDVPAKIISLWTKSYIENKWSGKVSSLKSAYNGAPVDALFELNLEAASLWDELVACHRGDHEQARLAYFNAKFQCSDRNYDGEKIRDQIAAYLANVENFFLSTGFPRAAMDCKSPMEFARIVVEEDTSMIIPPPAFPSLHPFFLQAALQGLLQQAPIGQRKNMQEFVNDMERGEYNRMFFNALSQLSAWIPESQCSTYGLWPSAGRSAIRALKKVSLDLVASIPEMKRLISIRDYKISPVGCVDKMLPRVYGEESDAIAIELKKISQRYKKKEARRCSWFSCN